MSRWPGLGSARCQLRLLDYAGTLAFASAGGGAAAAAGMDALGAVVVGTVTAVGGGTIRDAVVLRKAPFWTEEVEYLYLAIAAAGGTFLFWPRERDASGGRGVPREYAAMQWADAAGVGAFAVIGAQNGVRARMPALVSVICGVSTATFGGAVRDITLARPVRILHSHAELYASTAAAGAATYLAVRAAGAPVAARIAAGVGTAVVGRWVSWTYGVRLPVWEEEGAVEGEGTTAVGKDVREEA